MLKFFRSNILALALVSISQLHSANIILNFTGAPKDAYKGTGLKWKKINASGIPCFYAGQTSYSDQDGQVILTVPMPSLKKFDLVLGKNLNPKPVLEKTINHIAIEQSKAKTATIYHFQSEEVEVSNELETKDKTSIKTDKEDSKDKDKEEKHPAKTKKNLWTVTKGDVPEDGRLKNNTIIILIDSIDVVVPTDRFYWPVESPSLSLPPFFLVERDSDVDKNVLQSFDKPNKESAPMAAIHTINSFNQESKPQSQNKDLQVVVTQMEESKQE